MNSDKKKKAPVALYVLGIAFFALGLKLLAIYCDSGAYFDHRDGMVFQGKELLTQSLAFLLFGLLFLTWAIYHTFVRKKEQLNSKI